MLVGIHVKCLLFLSDFKQDQNILVNLSKYHVDYTVPCWQAGKQTDRHDKANSHISQLICICV
jgi:hypothetical protein